MVDNNRLKTVIDGGHPLTGDYSADAVEAAAQGHLVDLEEDVETVSGNDIFEAVVPADYVALSDREASLFHAIISMESVRVIGPNVRAALVRMFTGATATLAALAALQTRDVSHFQKERLGRVRVGDVQRARA